MQLSERVQAIKPSATMAISARAAEMKSQGIDIISLSAGEPDFNTPEPIKAAAIKAVQDNFTHYTQVDGIPDLKRSICDKLKRENQLDYSPKQILVSCGVKHSLFNLIQALINPGDEVIIPAPYWVSYVDIVMLCGGTPVVINTDETTEFKITPDQLGQHITNRSKLILLNSPSNPTGSAYTTQEWQAIGEVLQENPQLFIASDDIYEHILWSNEAFSNILNVCPNLYERTVVLNGVSKAYAMTGWRIGFAAGPDKLIAAMKKIQSQSTSNPNSIAQVAAIAAFDSGTQYITEMVKAFKERHDYLTGALNKIDNISCLPTKGTFYAFPNVKKLMEQMGFDDDLALAEALITKANVATVPGTAFGAPGYLRLSYATSMEQLEKAIARITQFVR